MVTLFEEDLQVVNVGLPAFGDAIQAAGGTVVQVRTFTAHAMMMNHVSMHAVCSHLLHLLLFTALRHAVPDR